MATKKEKKPAAPARKAAVKTGEVQKAAPARALSPFEEMDRMFDSMFEGFFPSRLLSGFGRGLSPWGEALPRTVMRFPKADVIDRDSEVVVHAEVPGIAKEDLEISVSDNSVTIKGETKKETKAEKGEYHRCEISRGSFSRTIALPSAVTPDGAKATFKDGMLELTLPKVQKSKRRTIKVS